MTEIPSSESGATASKAQPPVPPDNSVIVRAPTATEAARVRHLFRDISLPLQSQFLVVVKLQPVERFVAGLAGWSEGPFARFHLASPPGVDANQYAPRLIEEASLTARNAGLSQMVYGDLLTDDDRRAALLRLNGFTVLRSERFFRIDAVLGENRVLELAQKFARLIPGNWRTDSIRNHSSETILELLAPYRLMMPEEIRRHWRLDAVHGFEPDLSSILFEGEHPFGALLVRRMGDVVSFDVRVVNHRNRVLRGVANLLLLQHCSQHYDRERTPVRWLLFRGGEVEHRETANLAFRMGGEEVAPRRVFAREL
ncbi:MAG TPA: hypothetical protein VG938_18565 [Verrucomicrobiae bacterium]|jgi:hypothetical protein|nr:hypothetical protein [Verrucomicrobiae bacterium]